VSLVGRCDGISGSGLDPDLAPGGGARRDVAGSAAVSPVPAHRLLSSFESSPPDFPPD